MKGNTWSRTVSNICCGADSLKRDQRSLSCLPLKIGSSIGLPDAGGLALFQGVSFVQPLDEEQVGELLDDQERIRDAARPHRVPDAVYLGFECAGDHDLFVQSSLFISLRCSTRRHRSLYFMRQRPTERYQTARTPDCRAPRRARAQAVSG